MDVSTRLQPAAAATFLRAIPARLHGEDPNRAQRTAVLEAAAVEIDAIEPGYWYKKQVANAERAWSRAAKATTEAGLPEWSEALYSNVEALDGEVDRYESGQAGVGIPAFTAVTKDTISQASTAVGLGDPFDPQRAKGGKKGGKPLPLLTILKWGAPIILVGTGAWYFWPVISTALRARKRGGKLLEEGVDRGLDQAEAARDRYLPPPSGDQRGAADRAFEPEFPVDPFAETSTLYPLDDVGAFDGFGGIEDAPLGAEPSFDRGPERGGYGRFIEEQREIVDPGFGDPSDLRWNAE